MTRRGLFVGVDAYPADLGALSSCVNDAMAMRDACVGLGILGLDETTLMTDPSAEGVPAPTRDALLQWLLPLYDAAQSIDRLIVYLSGHGISLRLGREADELRTVFVPAGLQALRHSGGSLLDLDELIGRFRRRGARDQVWIIDACRNTVEPNPNVATIGWDPPARNDPREAADHAQATIFAVAPLAKAVAEKNGHGRLTRHLLDGLRCIGDAQWGAAADYDEASDGWVISCASLVRYARRRIELTFVDEDWRRDYELPRLRVAETAPQPLRQIGSIADRPFSVAVRPLDARVSVAISARRRILAGWPPLSTDKPFPLAPEVYRLTASLLDGSGKAISPALVESTIDIRETDRIDIQVPPDRQVREGGLGSGGMLPFGRGDQGRLAGVFGERGIASDPPLRADGGSAVPEPPARPEPEVRERLLRSSRRRDMVSVTVRALDPTCAIRLSRLSGGTEVLDLAPEAASLVKPGLWRLDLRLGREVVSSSTHDFGPGRDYAVTTYAPVGPVVAALLQPQAWRGLDGQACGSISLGATGPMQGAILATVLPLVALRVIDAHGELPPMLVPIPQLPASPDGETIMALALDGSSAGSGRKPGADALATAAGARLIWCDADRRVALCGVPAPPSGRALVLPLAGIGTLRAPLLRAEGCRAVLTVTLSPDRPPEFALALVAVPAGLATAARAARARAILAQLLAPASRPAGHGLVWAQEAATADDPILAALAWWWGRRRAAAPAEAEAVRDAVRSALARWDAGLVDARIIAALDSPDPDPTLDAMLDDPGVVEPALAESVGALARRALARGTSDHWSVHRFQQLGDSAFNVVLDPNEPEGEHRWP